MSRMEGNKNSPKRIKQLYGKLKDESISEMELEELYDFLSENDTTLGPEMWDTWKNSKVLLREEILHRHVEEMKLKVSDNRHRTVRFQIWGSVAAAVLLLIIAGIGMTRTDNTEYYSTNFGERETIQLPDGSIVELNAHSTLTWANDWEETGVRKVQLTGEAFFEVAHLPQNQKFEVRTSDLNIEVLGTSFNVLKRNTNTEVFLSEGKVKLVFEGVRSRNDTLIMAPGQKISYSKEQDRIINDIGKNIEKEASWKNGVLYFEDKSVEEILHEVSQVYGIEYSIPDSALAQKKMNFGVPYTDWETTKEAFELTMGLQIQEKNGKYILENK
ncbi:MAG TPA: FecR domain-containing protein [Membranihabitans sp.]|nr:FecR domain-containing protein [Membranihabitans sp.]